MTGAVRTKTYDPPPRGTAEILRYAGVPSPTPETEALLDDCLRESRDSLRYRVCWREFPLSQAGDYLDMTFARASSAALRRHLDGCHSIVLFAATVGVGLDRLINRYSRLSPARALMLQAIGAERIEALCDAFRGEIAAQKGAEGKSTRPRFSPGYGDLPLELQRDIFRVLDCPRQIGLTLNDSLLMSPSKSVTAIIGVAAGDCSNGQASPPPDRCAACGHPSCAYRRQL